MAAVAASGASGAGEHNDGRQDFARILFATISLMGLAVLLWCFASSLAPSRAAEAPGAAPLPHAMMNGLR
ncbi:unnamed protein product [Acidocella sp. C78]|uniref:hypothetical protein n=1 Tax=Acidocella sp. C78 TaxID=1671486 RepID=UPI00191B9078|nr:hypothetical protein [Acidocella sp. C78]CAG4910737.1 unnamed protein product [Acidocella sp. C78]